MNINPQHSKIGSLLLLAAALMVGGCTSNKSDFVDPRKADANSPAQIRQSVLSIVNSTRQMMARQGKQVASAFMEEQVGSFQNFAPAEGDTGPHAEVLRQIVEEANAAPQSSDLSASLKKIEELAKQLPQS